MWTKFTSVEHPGSKSLYANIHLNHRILKFPSIATLKSLGSTVCLYIPSRSKSTIKWVQFTQPRHCKRMEHMRVWTKFNLVEHPGSNQFICKYPSEPQDSEVSIHRHIEIFGKHRVHQVSIALSYGSSPETFWAFASVVN